MTIKKLQPNWIAVFFIIFGNGHFDKLSDLHCAPLRYAQQRPRLGNAQASLALHLARCYFTSSKSAS